MTEIFAREISRKVWEVFDGDPRNGDPDKAGLLIGRVAMRFGDVVAYSPNDAVLWKAAMTDEHGAVGQPGLSDDRVAHYRTWAVWHVLKRWESLQPGLPDVAYTLITKDGD